MTDDALTIHEECGGDVKKVFSSVGIVWKGAGFYKTDTRSGAIKPAGAKKAESSGSGDAASTPAKTSETKAPAKSENSGKTEAPKKDK